MREQIKRQETGLVVSSSRNKTVTVLIERRVKHPLYKKIETSAIAFQYHVARVATSILALHIFTQKSMTIQEFTELQTEILTAMGNKLWL